MFIIVSIYLSFSGYFLINNGLYIDDRLYLYSINFLACEPERWDQASRSLLEFLGQGSYSVEYVSVFRFRYEYSNNYLIHAAATCLARTALPQRLLDVDYGTWIYVIVQSGVGLSHLICFLIVLVSVWSARATKAPDVVLLGFVLLAYFAVDISTRNWRFTNAPTTFELLFQALVFAASPGYEFDVFGITPRSDATLLLVAIFVFRLRNLIGTGYWIVAFACLVHGTYGTLILIIFLSLDVLLRPSELRNWHCLVPIALVTAATLLRIRSFDAFEGTGIQLSALAVGLATFGGFGTSTGERLLGAFSPVRYLRNMALVHAETLLLFVGMVVSIVIALALATLNSGLTVKYVAQELSGRPIALMRVPFLLGVCAILIRIRIDGYERYLPALTVAASLMLVAGEVSKMSQTRKSWLTSAEMESAIRTTMRSPRQPITQLQLYYVLSCWLDNKCPIFDNLLKSRKER